MTRAAQSYDVLFIEEPIREPGATHHFRSAHPVDGVTVLTPVIQEGMSPELETASIRSLLDTTLALRPASRTISWYYSPMALSFSNHLANDLCTYDCMDELSAFRGAPKALTVMESWLFSRAHLVFTGGYSLYEAKRKWHDNVHAFPSSIDADHFGKATASEELEEPADQKAIPHPRIGFFGVIDERMNLDLIDQLAQLRPEWQFVMLGPVVKIDPSTLPRRPNLHWLGGKDYSELPGYLAGWDAGIMPFAMNEATRFISPTKTPEFLAAEVPVVSTPIRDVVRPYGDKGLVEIASTPEEFAQRIDLVMHRPKQAWLAEVREQLATTSWDKTWRDMQNLMEAKLSERTRVFRRPAVERAVPGRKANV
jgi:UDP-galactopyranose mutase